jgi:hypothetical protein
MHYSLQVIISCVYQPLCPIVSWISLHRWHSDVI